MRHVPGLINKYFPDLSDAQLRQFSGLNDLMVDWNRKINLVSRKDIDHLEERHILHSLSIARIIKFRPGTHIADIGTGGGFPGIPLAIMFPECQFNLIDSIGKKIIAVSDIIQSLGLTNAKARHIRAEEMKEKFDFGVCRAVAPLPLIVQWMTGKIRKLKGTAFNDNNVLPNGLLCLKGGDLENELAQIKNNKVVFDLSEYFSESFFETKKLVHVEL